MSDQLSFFFENLKCYTLNLTSEFKGEVHSDTIFHVVASGGADLRGECFSVRLKASIENSFSILYVYYQSRQIALAWSCRKSIKIPG